MMQDTFGVGAFGMHPHRGIETVSFVIDGSSRAFRQPRQCGSARWARRMGGTSGSSLTLQSHMLAGCAIDITYHALLP